MTISLDNKYAAHLTRPFGSSSQRGEISTWVPAYSLKVGGLFDSLGTLQSRRLYLHNNLLDLHEKVAASYFRMCPLRSCIFAFCSKLIAIQNPFLSSVCSLSARSMSSTGGWRSATIFWMVSSTDQVDHSLVTFRSSPDWAWNRPRQCIRSTYKANLSIHWCF